MNALALPSAASRAWHARPAAEAVEELRTDPHAGLQPDDAEGRLRVHGPNRLPDPPRRTRLRLLADQFSNLLVVLLLVAAGLALALGEPLEAGAILAIVALNAAVGYLQERRAADALESLRRLAAPSARVRRGGETLVVPAADLVPGDLVVLEAGDHVPADLRLVQASSFRANEAALTGESEAVEKDAGAPVDPSAPIPDRVTLAFLGTTVTSGFGEGVVVATGSATEFGRIALLVRETREEETPLQVRLRAFGRWLALASGVLIALVYALGLLRGIPPAEMFLASVGLAVAAVPEGLPAVVTLALALGVVRMARRNALVRRLAAVETLGCTTVIAADKTGTLTQGRMSVREPGPPGLLRAALASSSARLVERDGRTEVAGDPTEGAILEAARAAGVDPQVLDREEPVASRRPFDPARKRVSVVRRTAAGPRSYVKGAPEAILPLCAGLADPEALRREADGLARRGLRILAVAERPLGPGDDPEEELRFLGFLGLQDPPRRESRAAVEACRAAGIRPVMITGDHPQTGLAVAKEVGIAASEREVAVGADLDRWDDDALAERAGALSVYARVSPEHKLRIVRAWKRRGAVVAMTGDGVNDAPALQGADIGIAMGRSGSDVARDAASMVLTDDNFATLVAAVHEGRVIFENIRKTLLYLLAGNAAEILVMAAAVVAGWPLPLLPLQLLWINFVTDGLLALALAVDPADPDLLRRPPRRPGQEIADRDFVVRLLASAIPVALVTLAAFLAGLESSVETARTYAFSTLVAAEAFRAFVVRSGSRRLRQLGFLTNRVLAGVAAGVLAFQFLAPHWPFLAGVLRTSPLPLDQAAGLLALAVLPAALLEAAKRTPAGETPARA
jgi:Ca2+-transporting ATPase